MEGARISSPVDNHVLIPARTCPLAVHASQARRAASLAVGVPQASSPRMGSVCSQLTATATSSLEPWVSSASLPLISATRFCQQPWSSASFCLVLHGAQAQAIGSTHGAQAQAIGWELEALHFPHPGLVQVIGFASPSFRMWVMLEGVLEPRSVGWGPR